MPFSTRSTGDKIAENGWSDAGAWRTRHGSFPSLCDRADRAGQRADCLVPRRLKGVKGAAEREAAATRLRPTAQLPRFTTSHHSGPKPNRVARKPAPHHAGHPANKQAHHPAKPKGPVKVSKPEDKHKEPAKKDQSKKDAGKKESGKKDPGKPTNKPKTPAKHPDDRAKDPEETDSTGREREKSRQESTA